MEKATQDNDRRLWGNGQPGIMEKIDNRLTSIEKDRWKLAGAIALMLVLVELFGSHGFFPILK